MPTLELRHIHWERLLATDYVRVWSVFHALRIEFPSVSSSADAGHVLAGLAKARTPVSHCDKNAVRQGGSCGDVLGHSVGLNVARLPSTRRTAGSRRPPNRVRHPTERGHDISMFQIWIPSTDTSLVARRTKMVRWKPKAPSIRSRRTGTRLVTLHLECLSLTGGSEPPMVWAPGSRPYLGPLIPESWPAYGPLAALQMVRKRRSLTELCGACGL